MDADPLNQLGLLADLRHCAERGELSLAYQPKVDASRGRIRGFEALLRWQRPGRGPVEPSVFIPQAERFGLGGSLGQWVMQEACRQMREWGDTGLRIGVAINLSARQLREDDLADRLLRELDSQGVDPAQLLCEVGEAVAMQDIPATQRCFEALARIGVLLSIDGFGQGFSSLNALRQLPVCEAKIDQALVGRLEGSADARALADAAVRLAHALGLRVVAVGVQTQGQRDILESLGCDQLQGFLLARPMPAAAVPSWALAAGTAIAEMPA